MPWANTRWKVKNGCTNFDHTAKPSNVALPPNDGSTQVRDMDNLGDSYLSVQCSLNRGQTYDGLGIPLTEFAVSLQRSSKRLFPA